MHARNAAPSPIFSYQNRFGRRIFRWRRGSNVLLEHLPQIGRGSSNDETTDELFDLSKDPGEQVNLLESKPELASELRNELHGFKQNLDEVRVDFGSLPSSSLDALQALGYAGN